MATPKSTSETQSGTPKTKRVKKVEFVWDIGETSWSYEEQLWIIRRETFEYWRPRLDVFDCSTWADVAELGEEVYHEVLGMAGYSEFEEYIAHLKIHGSVALPDAELIAREIFDKHQIPPSPEDPFDAERLPSVGDGDWPPHIAAMMASDLPDEVLDKWAYVYETSYNGTYAVIEAKNATAAKRELRQLGFKVTEEPMVGAIPARNF
jgi:hypothetical protein